MTQNFFNIISQKNNTKLLLHKFLTLFGLAKIITKILTGNLTLNITQKLILALPFKADPKPNRNTELITAVLRAEKIDFNKVT